MCLFDNNLVLFTLLLESDDIFQYQILTRQLFSGRYRRTGGGGGGSTEDVVKVFSLSSISISSAGFKRERKFGILNQSVM